MHKNLQSQVIADGRLESIKSNRFVLNVHQSLQSRLIKHQLGICFFLTIFLKTSEPTKTIKSLAHKVRDQKLQWRDNTFTSRYFQTHDLSPKQFDQLKKRNKRAKNKKRKASKGPHRDRQNTRPVLITPGN